MEEIFTRLDCENRSRWLDERKGGIGGSSCSCIIGQNKYRTNEDYWLEKTGQKESEDISNKPYVRYGTLAEEHIRALFMLDYENELEMYYKPYELLIRKDKPFIRASLDGELLAIKDFEIDNRFIKQGMKGIWECKTRNIRSVNEIWDSGDIPMEYHCQRLHYFNTTKYDFHILRCDFVMFNYKYGYYQHFTRDYCILRSEVIDQLEYLEDEETHFWLDNVLKKKRPNLIIQDLV